MWAMILEWIVWIIIYGFFSLFILAAIAMCCCVIYAMVFAMCSIMEWLNKNGKEEKVFRAEED